jgi:RNA polymerase sigma-70 factor, ECF subfamily
VDYVPISSDDLVRQCVETGDESAWMEFIRRFQPVIARTVLRVARRWQSASPQLIDDLVQDTYLKLCANNCAVLKRFESLHEGSIFGYVQVVAANLAQDYFRAAISQKRGGKEETTSLDSAEPVSPCSRHESADATERGVFIAEIDVVLRSLAIGAQGERDRRIFWLYYRVGLAASAIAALPTIGLSTKGVESTLLRLTRHVREHLAMKSAPGQSSNARIAKGIEQAEPL